MQRRDFRIGRCDIVRFACPGMALMIAFLALLGCNREDLEESIFRNRVALSTQVDRELETLTNISGSGQDQTHELVLPAEVNQAPDRIELLDLGLVLRKVTFAGPIAARGHLFFSETEITNAMFAAYLADTRQQRDDRVFDRVLQQIEQGIPNDDGSVTAYLPSTSSPWVHVERRSSLWHNGTYPAGEHDYPVTYITIVQAADFGDWLTARYGLEGSFRLPTPEEWLFAAYGADRDYPWGNDSREWQGKSTEPVAARPELRTPEGLYGMWGNAAELVLSPFNGYGGTLKDPYAPQTTTCLGPSFLDEVIRGHRAQPRQDDWGYCHAVDNRSDLWGFRVVFLPAVEREKP